MKIVLHVGGWLVLAILGLAIPFVATVYESALAVAVAVAWNAVNARAIFGLREPWLHAAPYVSMFGTYLILWGLVDGASYGPWVYGYKPSPWWRAPLQWSGFILLFAWLAATVRLSLRRTPA